MLEGEEDWIKDLVSLFDDISKSDPFNTADLTYRVAHPKSIGVVKGEITVAD